MVQEKNVALDDALFGLVFELSFELLILFGVADVVIPRMHILLRYVRTHGGNPLVTMTCLTQLE